MGKTLQSRGNKTEKHKQEQTDKPFSEYLVRHFTPLRVMSFPSAAEQEAGRLHIQELQENHQNELEIEGEIPDAISKILSECVVIPLSPVLPPTCWPLEVKGVYFHELNGKHQNQYAGLEDCGSDRVGFSFRSGKVKVVEADLWCIFQ